MAQGDVVIQFVPFDSNLGTAINDKHKQVMLKEVEQYANRVATLTGNKNPDILWRHYFGNVLKECGRTLLSNHSGTLGRISREISIDSAKSIRGKETPMLTFNVTDVETANADRSSICQIGLVKVEDGQIRDTWATLLNPETWFDPFYVKIHRIDEKAVRDSPTLPEVRGELRERLRGSILVSHTPFDRVAFERAMKRYDVEQLQVTWLDSAQVVRRAWPEHYARRGYGLKNVAKHLGITSRHHDALEDARATAEIMLRACEAARLDIEGWLDRVKRPIYPRHKRFLRKLRRVMRLGNPEGPLHGETIVFTGALGISRWEATDMAANLGCNVSMSMSTKVTMLVIGIQDKSELKGYKKSRKHLHAELLISQGFDIQLLSEADFLELVCTSE